MKFWKTSVASRRVMHIRIGRWGFSLRRGRFKFNLEREYPGTFVASFGPLFVTGLRQAKQKTPPGGGASSGPVAPTRGCDSPIIAGSGQPW